MRRAAVLVADVGARCARPAPRGARIRAPCWAWPAATAATTKGMLARSSAQRGECLARRWQSDNRLGVPLTLLRLHEGLQSAVIEIGANRAGSRRAVQIAKAGVGLITNAGAEHLEGFGSLEGVARAEGEMVAGRPPAAPRYQCRRQLRAAVALVSSRHSGA